MYVVYCLHIFTTENNNIDVPIKRLKYSIECRDKGEKELNYCRKPHFMSVLYTLHVMPIKGIHRTTTDRDIA